MFKHIDSEKNVKTKDNQIINKRVCQSQSSSDKLKHKNINDIILLLNYAKVFMEKDLNSKRSETELTKYVADAVANVQTRSRTYICSN